MLRDLWMMPKPGKIWKIQMFQRELVACCSASQVFHRNSRRGTEATTYTCKVNSLLCHCISKETTSNNSLYLGKNVVIISNSISLHSLPQRLSTNPQEPLHSAGFLFYPHLSLEKYLYGSQAYSNLRKKNIREKMLANEFLYICKQQMMYVL